jgi:hypothetical protein
VNEVDASLKNAKIKFLDVNFLTRKQVVMSCVSHTYMYYNICSALFNEFSNSTDYLNRFLILNLHFANTVALELTLFNTYKFRTCLFHILY